MSRIRVRDLEVLARLPAGECRQTPLLFIHGAYTGAWCWEEYFLPFFAAAGYPAYAVSLRGHGGSAGHERLNRSSIADYVDDVEAVMRELPARPVLVGHSMGGMVVQKYLERASVPGAVLMAPAPPLGLWAAAWSLAITKPALLLDLHTLTIGGRVALEALREALFAHPVPPQQLARYYAGMQNESQRAIWDMTLLNLPQPWRMHRPPLLVLGAARDYLIPAFLVTLTGWTYRVRAEILPDIAHGMMLDRHWRRVAERILHWLDARGF